MIWVCISFSSLMFLHSSIAFLRISLVDSLLGGETLAGEFNNE